MIAIRYTSYCVTFVVKLFSSSLFKIKSLKINVEPVPVSVHVRLKYKLQSSFCLNSVAISSNFYYDDNNEYVPIPNYARYGCI